MPKSVPTITVDWETTEFPQEPNTFKLRISETESEVAPDSLQFDFYETPTKPTRDFFRGVYNLEKTYNRLYQRFIENLSDQFIEDLEKLKKDYLD